MKEVWRPIAGYEGLYEVSNLGRVKSLWHKTRRILKPALKHGYLQVNFVDGVTHKFFSVHRLVALAFIPNPENKPQVNHVNGDKTDNRVENLEWCTPSENMQHAVENGLMPQGADHPDSKFTNEQVLYIRENPDNLTTVQLAEMFDVTSSTISDVQLYKTYKNAGGKKRKYKPKPPRISDAKRAAIQRLYVKGSHEFGSTALARMFDIGRTTVLRIVKEVQA